MNKPIIGQLSKIIRDHISDNELSIELLCQKMGISRSQLHRKIKAETGISTSLFIRQIKLEKATELLQNSELNISEICYESGFISPQNFTKYFKKLHGVSPREYRKQLLSKKTLSFEHDKEIETTLNYQRSIGIATNSSKPGPKAKKEIRLPNSLKIIGSLLGLFLFLFFLKFYVFSNNTSTTIEKTPCIAILPFKSIGSDIDSLLGEGLAEELLVQLTKFKSLKILAPSSSFQYKNENRTQFASSLGASHLLEGTIRKHNGKIHILVHLIRTNDNQAIWSERYEHSTELFLEIPDKIAFAVAKKFNQRIEPPLAENMAATSKPNLAAYNAYLVGKQLMRDRSPEGIEKSLAQFEKALQLDSTYGPTYLGIATATYLKEDSKTGNWEKAEKLCLDAIRRDKKNGQAYALLAVIYTDQNKYEKALIFFEIALDLNPNDALINYWYSLRLREIGRYEKALEHGAIAKELDPLHPLIDAGNIYTAILAGKYDLAEELLQKSQPLLEDSYLYLSVKGVLQVYKKNYEEGVHILDQSLAINPTFPVTLYYRSYALGKLGKQTILNEIMAKLDENNSSDNLLFSAIYNGLGETDQGLFHLKKAADQGHISSFLLSSILFKSYRNSPIYKELVHASGLTKFDEELNHSSLARK